MADQANQVRVNDARNQLAIAQQDLTYNKDSGFLTRKGANAFLDNEGKPLEKPLDLDYGEKLKAQIDGISANLGNDAQRKAFGQHAGSAAAQFHGQLQSHTLKEFGQYKDATDDATAKLAGQSAGLNWNNPDAVNASLGQAKAAIRSKAERAGLVGTPFDEAVLAGTSAIHERVIQAALQNRNPAYAATYMKEAREKGEMTASDIMKVQGHITEADALKQSQAAVQQQTVAAMPAIAPTGFDRLKAVRTQIESGSMGDFKPDGTPVTSSAGAKYKNQVMDATAANPGFGIKPANTSGTPQQVAAEYNRVGDELLEKLVQKYGNASQALAAYNAGSGRLDQALKDAAKGRSGSSDWLSYMPPETQAYVAKATKILAGSGPVAPRPTELDFVNGALARLGPDASPQAVKHTTEAARTQFGVINKTLNEKGDNALADAQRWVLDNKATSLAQLPPPLKDALMQFAPGKMDDLGNFAKAQGNVPTDWPTYTALRALAANEPKAFAATDLRQHFMALAPAEREKLVDLQTKAKTPEGQNDIATLGQQLATAHGLLGLKNSDHKKKGQFDDAVTQALAAEKRDKGKALTFEERDRVIKRMMLPARDLETSWISDEKRIYQVAGTPDEKQRPPNLGDDDRKLITIALADEGVQPTEQNITARFKLRYGIK